MTRLIVASIISEEIRTGGGGSGQGQISPEALKLLLSVVMALRAMGVDNRVGGEPGGTGGSAGGGGTAAGNAGSGGIAGSGSGTGAGAGANVFAAAMDVHRSVGEAIGDVIVGVISLSPTGGGTTSATVTTTTTTATTAATTTATAATTHHGVHNKGDKGQLHADKGQGQVRMEVVEGLEEGQLAPASMPHATSSTSSTSTPPVKLSRIASWFWT